MPARTRKAHLEPLTSLRFFAAMHVMLYHSAEWLLEAIPQEVTFVHDVLGIGFSGVNFFFVLSGFILAYTYLDPERDAIVDQRDFWIARIARIYPVYALSMLVVAPDVIQHFFSENPPGVAAVKTAVSGGAAFTLVQAWIPPVRTIWNTPGWSLSAEAFFYLLFPFLVGPIWRLGRRGALVLGGAVWLIGFVPVLLAIPFLSEDVLSVSAVERLPDTMFSVALRITPLLRLNEFVLGIALARAFFPSTAVRAVTTRQKRWTLLVVAALASLAAAAALAHYIPRLLVHAGLFDPLYGALIVGLGLCGGPIHRVMSHRALVVLGQASYGIYIFHIPVRIWLTRLAGGEPSEHGLAFLAVYVTLVIAISIFVFFRIEDPARLWIRKRWGDHRTPSTAVEAPA